jgi:hypothetical protein
MLAFVTVVVGFFYVFTVFDCELKKKKIKSMKSSKQPTNYIRKILKYTVLRFESLFFLQISFFFGFVDLFQMIVRGEQLLTIK